MKRKKKIFRPKRRYRIKRRNNNVLKIVMGAAAVAALVFVGYSVAGPISTFISEHRSVQEDTGEWTPTETEIDDGEQTKNEQPDSGENNAEIVLPEIVEKDHEELQTTEPPVTETEPFEIAPEIRTGGAAYMLSEESMADMVSLEAELDEVMSSGCSAVIFPVKTEGGIFHYATEIELVHTVYEGADPIASDITANELVQAANSRGLRAVALVSVLNDNNRYGDYRDGSYRTEDDDAWLDASPDKGGKPWLSPFDDVTVQYCSDIVRELAAAGFTEIIADDFIFPEFRSSDIELIGEYVEPYSDRYLALTGLAQSMTEAGSEAGVSVMLRITANSIIKGYSELFDPDELAGCSIIIDYSENNISRTMVYKDDEVVLGDMEIYEKISAVFGAVSSRCDGIATQVIVERDSMTADEFDDAVRAITALGYDIYYVY